MTAVFAGLAPAVIAIVVQAVLRVGRRALAHPALVAIAVGAFLALAVFAVPFPIVIAAAGAGRLGCSGAAHRTPWPSAPGRRPARRGRHR